MNFLELYIKLTAFITSVEVGKIKIKARFDFPIHGNPVEYEVTGLAEDGTLILKNHEVQRPLGH